MFENGLGIYMEDTLYLIPQGQVFPWAGALSSMIPAHVTHIFLLDDRKGVVPDLSTGQKIFNNGIHYLF
ncbi:hypothetical protein [Desulfonatronum parangueonense]